MLFVEVVYHVYASWNLSLVGPITYIPQRIHILKKAVMVNEVNGMDCHGYKWSLGGGHYRVHDFGAEAGVSSRQKDLVMRLPLSVFH